MEIILKYFPNLTDTQKKKFAALWDLYHEWNAKINVISRKDIDNLYLHHILHSLSIAKLVRFSKGSKILDLGTGGGFPGIPCAILFPEVEFTLIDGTNKKITVCKEISKAIELDNVTAIHQRAENYKGKHDFVITRAVATIDKLWQWSRKLIHDHQKNSIPNGLIALKGGNLRKELKLLHRSEYKETHPISKFFEEEYYQDKYIVYVQY